MERKDLLKRTRQFHIDVLKLCRQLPKDPAGYETGKQLARSAGSVGANYRASKRAKSDADFHYKIQVILEEADESEYWLGIARDSQMIAGTEVDRLVVEAGELTSIFAASEKTLRNKRQGPKPI